MDMSGTDGRLRKKPSAIDVMVHFDSVQKTYDGKTLVVADLNLEVFRGEFLTMLGPSGSGKSTTLMMLGGFEQPTRGRILLENSAVERLPPEKRDIGFVFQNYALFPHMTVRENIAFPLRYRRAGIADPVRRVEEALALVKLDGLGDRKPQQLSGGQQQRVALARAMVFNPKLILMDEPLGALDKQLREHMQIEIKQIQQRSGITMVYVTHDQSEALAMSDRIAVFHEGRVQQLADPATLYERPDNRFVAGFIGENNLIGCRLEGSENGVSFVRMADGQILQATRSKDNGRSDMTLSVRPEKFRLLGDGDTGSGNSFKAHVIDKTYLGDRVRLTAEAFGRDRVVAAVPAAQGHSLGLGDEVLLGCDPSDCRLLAE